MAEIESLPLAKELAELAADELKKRVLAALDQAENGKAIAAILRRFEVEAKTAAKIIEEMLPPTEAALMSAELKKGYSRIPTAKLKEICNFIKDNTGMSFAEIGKELGISAMQASRWFSEDQVQKFHHTTKTKLSTWAIRKLREMIGEESP